MTYPYDKNEIEAFVPQSLKEIDNPPTFYLRPGTIRERKEFNYLAVQEGVQNHSSQAYKEEMLAGLKDLAGDEEYSNWEPRVKALWDANDEYVEQYKDTPFEEIPEFNHPDEKVIGEILNEVKRNWPPIRAMAADNLRFSDMLPILTGALVIEKFENINVPIKKRGKYLHIDCVQDAIEWLTDNHGDAPVSELRIACLLKMNFVKEQEKKSESPSPSLTDPQTLKSGKESTNGTSKASASSRKTQES